ncbi:MAG: signal peptidase II [Bacillota bacterium]|uniref:Lipoprotein signal peptidase n=2 Tax=Carboxydocella TaxID=178898 RepID=A0A1T4NMJ9_9FIRM|nr:MULTISPECIES: signal peptidase II [Carboxydocella]AVX20112.1 signal peptidase II [Carboxydocella thermautotrophica]AVX30529.1 signal peptidase II [Carboxydocella thermautotrophica]SJZ80490.1 signal peptidase II . Aspartic peptidase. MEROPS family A08 [Carboxydocella sporoproducens DSM 16521]GAW28464.1 signal peptidase II [Carboxydocella sp. ULO1]GAW31759.1 signal peptidase II [Carboxydocella sp. JDF658]
MFWRLLAGWLALDQLTKYLVLNYLPEGNSIPIWPGVFHLTHVSNPGAAFGLMPFKTGLFLLVALVVVAVVLFYLPRIGREQLWLRTALALQAAGAIGNAIDRLRFGYVVDFLDFQVWPVFNVADIGITVGVGMLIWHLWQQEKKEEVSEHEG